MEALGGEIPLAGLMLAAIMMGAMTHIDPCCGAATVIWGTAFAGLPVSRRRLMLVSLVLARIVILGAFGAALGWVGVRVAAPWAVGFLMLGLLFLLVGGWELRRTLRTLPGACPVPFARVGRSPYVMTALLLIPPPLAFPVFGLAFGGVYAASPLRGLVVLMAGALGLSLPLLVLAASPRLYQALAARLGAGRRWPAIAGSVYILVGAVLFFIFAAVLLAEATQ